MITPEEDHSCDTMYGLLKDEMVTMEKRTREAKEKRGSLIWLGMLKPIPKMKMGDY